MRKMGEWAFAPHGERRLPMSKAKPSHTGRAKHLRIPWDKYEIALLLDMYLHFENGELSRKEAKERLSDTLRRMAVNRGIMIDDTYRNENGMSYYLDYMAYALFGKGSLSNVPRVCRETVNLYLNNYEQYEIILREAQRMAKG